MKIVAWLSGILAAGDPPPAPVDSAKPPVVVVHGIHATAQDMERLVRALRADGREVFAPTLTPHNGTATIEELSAQLEEFIEKNVSRRPFDLIGYSMGGVVTRHYLQRRGGLAKVRRYVSLCAPHHGTWTAHFHGGAGTRQMRRNSTFLRELNADAEALRQIPFTSFWTWTDVVIVPASSGVMLQAENIRVTGIGHVSFILEPRFIRRVVATLQ